MLALGSKALTLPDDLEIGRKLTDGCVWLYGITKTGVMPEALALVKCDDPVGCQWQQEEWLKQILPGIDQTRVQGNSFPHQNLQPHPAPKPPGVWGAGAGEDDEYDERVRSGDIVIGSEVDIPQGAKAPHKKQGQKQPETTTEQKQIKHNQLEQKQAKEKLAKEKLAKEKLAEQKQVQKNQAEEKQVKQKEMEQKQAKQKQAEKKQTEGEKTKQKEVEPLVTDLDAEAEVQRRSIEKWDPEGEYAGEEFVELTPTERIWETIHSHRLPEGVVGIGDPRFVQEPLTIPASPCAN